MKNNSNLMQAISVLGFLAVVAYFSSTIVNEPLTPLHPLILLIGGAAFLLIVQRPFIGYLLLILTNWYDAFYSGIFFGGITLNRIISVVILMALLRMIIIRRNNFRLLFTRFDLAFVALLLVILLSMVLNGTGVRTDQQLISIIVGYFYYWFAINTIREEKQLTRLFIVIVLVSVPLAISVIYESLTNNAALRYSGIQDVAATSQQLAVSIPMLLYISRNKLLLNRIFVPLLIFLFLIAIILTGTRAAVVALLVGYLCAGLLLTLQGRARTVLIVAIIGIISFSIVLDYAPRLQDRYDALIQVGESKFGTDLSFEARAQVYERAINAFLSNPIMGIGYGFLQNYDGYSRSSHNVFLSIAGELGLMGLVPLIFMYLYTLRQLLVLCMDSEIDKTTRQGYLFILIIFIMHNVIFASFSISLLDRNMFMYFGLASVPTILRANRLDEAKSGTHTNICKSNQFGNTNPEKAV